MLGSKIGLTVASTFKTKAKTITDHVPRVWVKMVAWGKVEGVGDGVGWMKD